MSIPENSPQVEGGKPTVPRQYRYVDPRESARKLREQRRLTRKPYPQRRQRAKLLGPIRPARFYIHPDLIDRLPWDAKYVLEKIHWGMVRYKVDANGYVRLKADYLRRVLGKSYRKAVHLLLSLDIIERDETYVRGKKAYGYRITPAYRRTVLTFCEDERLNRRIAEVYAEDALPLLAVHQTLKKWFDLLEGDLEAAREIIATLRPKKKRKPKVTQSAEEYRLNIEQSYRRFLDGPDSRYFSVNRLGRLHNDFVGMKRELRKTVRLDGRPLRSVDVSACQPLLLGVIVRDFYLGSKWSRSRLLSCKFEKGGDPYRPTTRRLQPPSAGRSPRSSHPSSSTPLPPTTPPSSPLYTTIRVPERRGEPGLTESTTRYRPEDCPEVPGSAWALIDLAAQGSRAFYEPLRRPGEKLKDTKLRFLATLFSGNNDRKAWVRETRDQLNRLYPEVGDVVRQIKSKDHTKLACLLQNLEATLMVYLVCSRLTKERPEIPLVPVHDAIYTFEEYLPDVAAIIRETWAERAGVVPALTFPE
jgi:hypothetical protein